MFFPENQFKLILNEFLKGRKVNQNLNKMMFRKMKKVLAPKKMPARITESKSYTWKEWIKWVFIV